MIYDLPLEHWRPKILFAIASGIGIPLDLDEATSSKKLGYVAKILADLDLLLKLCGRCDDFFRL